ncbi:MAG: DUF4127 family protein, partial [Vulcanimicrobiota bacterium]
PAKMAKMAGCQLVAPPCKLLGKFLSPGKTSEILDWLENLAESFDFSIISVDMPLYGGLVASRAKNCSLETVEKRLGRFEEIIARKKGQLGKVYIFNSLLRAAPTFTDETLLPIAQKIIDLSCESYLAQKGDEVAARATERIEKEIPPNLLKAYWETRDRNHEIDVKLLQLMAEGLADYMLIGLDDSKTIGLNILEKEELENIIEELGIGKKVTIAPGADESALLLMARGLSQSTEIYPRICPVYSNPGGEKITPRYEDRNIEEIIELHTEISGSQLVHNRADADILLYVHTPISKQLEASSQHYKDYKNDFDQNFVSDIKNSIKEYKRVAMADIFYANGADLVLANSLIDRINILKLWSYAAWNTAGNTTGTVISQSVLRFVSEKTMETLEEQRQMAKQHLIILLERLADDWLYQSEVRQILRTKALELNLSIFHLEDWTEHFNQEARNLLKERLYQLFDYYLKHCFISFNNGNSYKIERLKDIRIHLPWDRLFEVSVNLDMDLAPVSTHHGDQICGEQKEPHQKTLL